MDYPVKLVTIADEDGGGFLAYYPDLVGCASDGETPAEALANAKDAFEGWMEIAGKRQGFTVPDPGAYHGDWRQSVVSES